MPIFFAMNLFDAIIIYLACGAPFGVYNFVNLHDKQNRIFFKPVLIWFFWLPFAIGLFHKYVTGKLTKSAFSKNEVLIEQEINETKKKLEEVLLKHSIEISVFEIREILERYIGLTNALEYQVESDEDYIDLFEIAETENIRLASKCYQRRNRRLLSHHQTLAGQDFLKLIEKLVYRFPDDKEINKLSWKLVNLLNDEVTGKNLAKIFNNGKQSANDISVKRPEKELWKNDLPQPITAKTVGISINHAAAKINLPFKD